MFSGSGERVGKTVKRGGADEAARLEGEVPKGWEFCPLNSLL